MQTLFSINRFNRFSTSFQVYKREPERYNIDAGDVSYMKGIKKKLKCRHFSYFLNVVVPDMLERYPFEEPPGFAFGAIQSEVNPSKCIDTLGAKREQPVGLYPCKKPLTNPGWHQTFK